MYVCVYMYVCVHVCKYVCMDVYMYVDVPVLGAQVCTHVRACMLRVALRETVIKLRRIVID